MPSVTFDELRSSLLYYKHNIVHFSGMGLPDSLLIEDKDHSVKRVTEDDLANIFRLTNNSKNIRCIVPSAPYSLGHAESIKNMLIV